MKITIVGAGAMGTLFAGLLAAKNRISIFEKDAGIRARIAGKGIIVTGLTSLKLPPEKFDVVTDLKSIRDSDLIIVFVKSYDTLSVIKEIRGFIGKNAFVMTLQNGLGNYETILKYADERKAVCGTTSHGATLTALGVVDHTGRGETIIGCAGNAGRIAGNFKSCGINTKTVKNIDSALWSKLVINCAINAAGTAAGVVNGEILKYDGVKEVAFAAGREAAAVAKALGIKLLFDDVPGKIADVCEKTYGNTNSMLADIIAGRRTEIEFLNGALVKKAEEIGIKVPVNSALCSIIKEMAPPRARRKKTADR